MMARMARRPRTSAPITGPGQLPTYTITAVGISPVGLRDIYHALLSMPWWGTFAIIVGGYLALNAGFALLYMLGGGIANAARGSFVDAFFFSVQTMGTIGYGWMYPVTRFANVLVVAESVTGLVVTALATGLVFVRFSQPRGRVAFSRQIAIGPLDGVPTLMIRAGNERSNLIFDAVFRLTMNRKTTSKEGVVIYRTLDLPLVRERAPALTRAWIIQHRIGPDSPLHGDSPESLHENEVELTLTLSGADATSLQPVHAQKHYADTDVMWGARLADIISETPEGNLILDLRLFHDVVATEPTAEFPYPRPAAGRGSLPEEEGTP
jgi:inward rectifier potassium channel